MERRPEDTPFLSYRCRAVDSCGARYQQTRMGCREISWFFTRHRCGGRQRRFEMLTSNNLQTVEQ